MGDSKIVNSWDFKDEFIMCKDLYPIVIKPLPLNPAFYKLLNDDMYTTYKDILYVNFSCNC